jgi:hypothetical protein
MHAVVELYICCNLFHPKNIGSSWLWSYGSLIYNYLCNQCLVYVRRSCMLKSGALLFYVWTHSSILLTLIFFGLVWFMVLNLQHYVDKICQWLVTGRWFSPCTPVSSTNKTDRHDITEILLKVALSTINQTNPKNIKVNKIEECVQT